jgi:Xaa-Pro aminopeptidase
MPFHYTDVPSIYRAFASRLEDGVLVAEQDCEVLSNICSKEIDDFEKKHEFYSKKKSKNE